MQNTETIPTVPQATVPMHTPYFYEIIAAADRDQALIEGLGSVAKNNSQFRADAVRLMADATLGRFKDGWQEEAEGIIIRAFGSPALQAILAEREAV